MQLRVIKYRNFRKLYPDGSTCIHMRKMTTTTSLCFQSIFSITSEYDGQKFGGHLYSRNKYNFALRLFKRQRAAKHNIHV